MSFLHFIMLICVWGGTKKTLEFIYKKLCIYFCRFKLPSPSKCSPFDAIHLLDTFSTAEKSFWTHWFWCLLLLLLFFLFHLFHISKMLSFEDFFHPGKQRKGSLFEPDQVNREGGAWESCCCWSKTAEHSAQVRDAHSLITHCAMGKHVKKVFQKNSSKPNTASHNNASWCTDTDGLLEHSPSGENQYYKGPTFQK